MANDVSAFAIDGKTGALTQLRGSPYSAGKVPLNLEIDDAGRTVYVANSGSNSVSIYRIEQPTGQLTALGTVMTPGSAFSITLK